jgi:two-component system chemotaxis response regulator CheB
VSIAPAGVNVIVRRGLRVELMPPLSGQFHVPGIDATFTSVAESCAGRAIGVLLTGMGRDGAAGLRRLRESGAMTIGQDEATSIVYGMPAAARALNAVELELALPHVASTLIRLLDRPAPPARSRP